MQIQPLNPGITIRAASLSTAVGASDDVFDRLIALSAPQSKAQTRAHEGAGLGILAVDNPSTSPARDELAQTVLPNSIICAKPDASVADTNGVFDTEFPPDSTIEHLARDVSAPPDLAPSLVSALLVANVSGPPSAGTGPRLVGATKTADHAPDELASNDLSIQQARAVLHQPFTDGRPTWDLGIETQSIDPQTDAKDKPTMVLADTLRPDRGEGSVTAAFHLFSQKESAPPSQLIKADQPSIHDGPTSLVSLHYRTASTDPAQPHSSSKHTAPTGSVSEKLHMNSPEENPGKTAPSRQRDTPTPDSPPDARLAQGASRIARDVQGIPETVTAVGPVRPEPGQTQHLNAPFGTALTPGPAGKTNEGRQAHTSILGNAVMRDQAPLRPTTIERVDFPEAAMQGAKTLGIGLDVPAPTSDASLSKAVTGPSVLPQLHPPTKPSLMPGAPLTTQTQPPETQGSVSVSAGPNVPVAEHVIRTHRLDAQGQPVNHPSMLTSSQSQVIIPVQRAIPAATQIPGDPAVLAPFASRIPVASADATTVTGASLAPVATFAAGPVPAMVQPVILAPAHSMIRQPEHSLAIADGPHGVNPVLSSADIVGPIGSRAASESPQQDGAPLDRGALITGLPVLSNQTPLAINPSTLQTAAHPLPAQQMAQALATAVRQGKNGQIDLILQPRELGHIRFEMTTVADRIHVIISAERPESMDMIRRNADQLMADLRQSGFEQATLGFGSWAAQDQSSNPKGQPDGSLGEDRGAPSFAALSISTPSSGQTADGRLDLRL